ncbi:cyclic nucleotide-gated ion channel 1-like [Rosa chinensis]|uniref:cyclic nucleotide-gated ion channel 1-like n=1 Tax=Rosa chinensis TaxID=74649 RepID=UPI000D08A87E|nr:cyclic nucleotide-gated ion channel 1-like [Rosa chinensis]
MAISTEWDRFFDRFTSIHPRDPTLSLVSFTAKVIVMYLLPFITRPVNVLADDIPPVDLSSMVYLLLDPLFLYAPSINQNTKCISLDNKLKTTALLFRSWGDLHYLFRIYEGLKVCWRKGPTYEKMLGLAGDAVAVLPIPQVAILIFLPKMRGSNSVKTMTFFNSIIVLQYLPRGYPLYLLCKNISMLNIDDRGFTSQKWLLIFANIYGYIIASHIFGAFWYFFSIQREIECWGHACRIENGCEFSTSCVQNPYRNITLLENLCPVNPPNKQVFDFGIFHDALQSSMQGSTNFLQKCSRSFSWGLRNLSSFGSNLDDTSAYAGENLFVVLISISGLVLFMYLWGNVQTFMQMVSEKKMKKMKMEGFKNKLKKVDGLKDKGEEVLEKICEYLEPMTYSKGHYIIREGEPLDMMFFVTRGSVLTYATNSGGSNGSSGTIQRKKEKDDLYGKELLAWAKESSELSNLPISAITVKSHNRVEVFAIQAIDLQLAVSKFQSQFSLTIAVDHEIVN